MSKARLDIFLSPPGRHFQVGNDDAGHDKLQRELAGHDVRGIVMEATGKLHRRVHRRLAAAGLPVAVLNPYRARSFAASVGQLAKTDKIDARILALLAQKLQPEPTPPVSETLEEIQELVSAWHSAKSDRAALKNRLAAAETAFLRAELEHPLHALDLHIERLGTEILRRIKQDGPLARRLEILLSVPGIGDATAATLIACLDELGRCTDKQIAALAGVAPMNCDSGEKRGQQRIRGGRQEVRNILYMAAVSAGVRGCNAPLKTFYNRLRKDGKPIKLAITGVMRKLLVLVNALIKENRLWQPIAP